MSFQLIGCVLCGGSSLRMGRNKFNLSFSSNSWLEKITQTLSPFCDEVVWSFRDEKQVDELEVPVQLQQKIICDDNPGEGPLGAWLSVSQKFPQAKILSVPVDMPLVEERHCRVLSDSVHSSFIKSSEDYHYLFALIFPHDLRELKTYFEQGMRSAHGFWESISANMIEISEANHLKNFNNPQDLTHLDSFLGKL